MPSPPDLETAAGTRSAPSSVDTMGSGAATPARRRWWLQGTRWALMLGLSSMATKALGTSGTITVGGVGSVSPLIQRLAMQFERAHPGTRVQIVQPPMGSTGSLRALSAHRIDVAVTGQPVGPTETGLALPWLRTPVVFASSSGMLDALDVPTLQAIYSGERRRWPDGSPLRLVLRATAESETIALREALPELNPALDAALARRDLPMPDDDLAALEFLARVKGTFGTTSLGLVNTLKAPVRILPFEGVQPQADPQLPQRYRLWRGYHLVHRSDPSAEVSRFVDFLRAPATLRVGAPLGYLPLAR